MSKNVAVIGSGGREHALCETLKTSSQVGGVFCCPGNGGTALSDGIENLRYDNFADLSDKLKNNSIDLVVVGPEAPLSQGIKGFLQKRGIKVFGLNQKAAQLESSKAYADRFKQKHGVSHPPFQIFSDFEEAKAYLEERFSGNGETKLWIKADELCGGKGAFGVSTLEEGRQALGDLLKEKKCGVGEKVTIQDDLSGQEATILTFTDGETYVQMPPMQDHKPVYDGGKGPNTGGMGAYAPAKLVDDKVKANFEKNVLSPTMSGIRQDGLQSSGILYFGLMVDEQQKPHLLEYNVRFGDPEAQPVLPLLETDLFSIFQVAVNGNLKELEGEISWSGRSAVCVVLATGGYPVDYGDENHPIEGIREAEKLEGLKVYHAGTKLEDGKLYTDGGRVLGVTGIADSLEEARKKAYLGVEKIYFPNMHYRTDIARDIADGGT